LPAVIDHVFLLDRIGDLSSPTKEIEIFANRASVPADITTKSVVVEIVASLHQLVTQTVISLFEFEGIVNICLSARQSRKGIVRLRKPWRSGVVLARVETKKRHG
jgi:hypothetical protein